MAKVYIIIIVFTLFSCNSNNHSLQNNITAINIDSILYTQIQHNDNLGGTINRTFTGSLLYVGETIPEATLIIANQEYSGDGVYILKDSTGNILSTGRQYTLRGDAENQDATVYQLIGRDKHSIINLLKSSPEKLILLDSAMYPTGHRFEMTLTSEQHKPNQHNK